MKVKVSEGKERERNESQTGDLKPARQVYGKKVEKVIVKQKNCNELCHTLILC